MNTTSYIKVIAGLIMSLAASVAYADDSIMVDNLYYTIDSTSTAYFAGYDMSMVENGYIDSLLIPGQIEHAGNIYKVSGIASGSITANKYYYDEIIIGWLSIPGSVIRIANGAFGSVVVEELVVNSEFPPLARCSSFGVQDPESTALTADIVSVTIPEGSLRRYKNAPGWKGLMQVSNFVEKDGLTTENSNSQFFERFGWVAIAIIDPVSFPATGVANICYPIMEEFKAGSLCHIPWMLESAENFYVILGIEAEAFYQTNFSFIYVDENIIYLGDCAFAENSAGRVYGLQGVETVGQNCFASSNLRKFGYPMLVDEIAPGCFACPEDKRRRFELLELHQGITRIHNGAFANTDIEVLFCYNPVPPQMNFDGSEEGSFAYNCTFEKLYVPAGSVEDYKAATGWREFEEILPIRGTAIDDIGCDELGEPEYFNLQGVKIENPSPGNIYIIRSGNTTVKKSL